MVHLPVAALWYGQLDLCHGDPPFLVGDRPEGTGRNVPEKALPSVASMGSMRKGRLKHATFSFDVVCAWDGGQQSLGHYLVELDLSNGYAEPNSLLKLDMAQVCRTLLR